MNMLQKLYTENAIAWLKAQPTPSNRTEEAILFAEFKKKFWRIGMSNHITVESVLRKQEKYKGGLGKTALPGNSRASRGEPKLSGRMTGRVIRNSNSTI